MTSPKSSPVSPEERSDGKTKLSVAVAFAVEFACQANSFLDGKLNRISVRRAKRQLLAALYDVAD